jgi:hypothetical protein
MSYINLLFAELFTTPEQFQRLRAKADANRKTNPFQVAMNEGIARDTVGELSSELVDALEIAAQVGPVLAQNSRGNPRETKRFLNRFLLRKATAEKRGMDLEADKLAKFMVLEQMLDQQHFERVFTWQLASDTGAPDELRLAEQLARGEKPKAVPPDVEEWVAQPKVADWLKAEPSLAGVNLAPYFTFSRERLARLITAPRLSSELQRLLAELQNDNVDPRRAKAVEDALNLEDAARAELLPALLDAAAQNLDAAAGKSLRELAAKRTEIATAMFDLLDKLPRARWKGTCALNLGIEFKSHPRTRLLLERWAEKGTADVKRQAARALARL